MSWDQLIDEFRNGGLLISVDHELFPIPVQDNVGQCLYRLIHEGLTNVLRHAGPTCSVQINVVTDDEGLSVCVSNDLGEAAPAHAIAGGGFGLASLRRDVASLGGVLEAGKVSDGWRLAARLPATPTRQRNAPAPPRHGGSIPVVLIDDQAMVREGLRLLLESNADIQVAAEFSDGRELLAYLGLNADGTPATAPMRAPSAYVELL